MSAVARVSRAVSFPRHATVRPVLGVAAVVVSLGLSGCGVVAVAGATAGAAISVAGAVVSTGVKVTGKVIEKTIDAVTPAAEDAAK
ncbi:hypothetical protein [Sphaerotilus sp.]|jgi:hypothetical protein|uniref:hypothetical protein n=1 Tax=Sphaerotilus sp. TaxID=2093942 RepID=UPI0025F2B34D|nr:hypothetical protein [Sphaerotilus sp.]